MYQRFPHFGDSNCNTITGSAGTYRNQYKPSAIVRVAVLSVNNPQTGIQYQWYAAATGGTPLYTGATFTTPVLTANTSYYVEADNANACASAQRVQANVIVVSKNLLIPY